MRSEALLRLLMREIHPRQIIFVDNVQDFGRADDVTLDLAAIPLFSSASRSG